MTNTDCYIVDIYDFRSQKFHLCRFLVRTVTLNGKVKIKNSQIQRVSRTKSAQFAKHIP